MLAPGSIIGVMGGGQLARMFALKAVQYGYHVHIYSDNADCPAKDVSYQMTVADYKDEKTLASFCNAVNVVTVEFENIPAKAASFIAEKVDFFPAPDMFAVCRDRGKEKVFIKQAGGQTARYAVVHSQSELEHAVANIGMPCIVKTTTEGYDGKGQFRINNVEEIQNLWTEAGERELIVEAFVSFASEASAIIARNQEGDMHIFPIADNEHKEGILHRSVVPTRISELAQSHIIKTAQNIAEYAQLIGLLAIEFFIMDDNSVLVNEMAPRPHNSGHWTMNGCNVCQFEQLLRICTRMPLKHPYIIEPTVMTNIIGEEVDNMGAYYKDKDAHVHLYGKKMRPGRKMGHVNHVALRT